VYENVIYVPQQKQLFRSNLQILSEKVKQNICSKDVKKNAGSCEKPYFGRRSIPYGPSSQ